MISQRTIDEVLAAADIVQVVGDYVKLKRSGSNHSGACPFHNEKTGSFVVSASKQIYKCFGCGVSGGSIRFIMEHEKMSFPDAIRTLAAKYSITVEEDGGKQSEETRNLVDDIIKVNEFAQKKYREQLESAPADVLDYLSKRFTQDDLLQWKIGWAPEVHRFLAGTLVESGLFEAAKTCGIVQSDNGKNSDRFWNRIMFPIEDRSGRTVGFGARIWPPDNKKGGKYLNSHESAAYHKSYILYGLQHASKEIAKTGVAFLVEGYVDVIAMHRGGDINTVATCGTALTEHQVKLLKRHGARKVIVLRDNDAAGLNAAEKDVQLLLPEGFAVEIGLLPEGMDPDDYFAQDPERPIQLPEFFDAVIWLSRKKMAGIPADDLFQRGKALEDIIKLLQLMPEGAIRNNYIAAIAKEFKFKETEISGRLKENKRAQHIEELTDEDEALKKLSPKQREEYLRHGFFTKKDGAKTGYYFGSQGQFKARTNFIINPLYHVYGSDNRRMMLIDNGIEEAVVEVPSKALLSPDQLLPLMFDQGYFIPREGFAKDHLYKILGRIGSQFPLVHELHVLGWQAEGFFAYQDKLYVPSTTGGDLHEYNEYGVVQVGKQYFLSPSKSRSQEKNREGENMYENDLYLQYKESPLSFEKWCELMANVYGIAGWMGIAWSVGTLFRDIIIKTAPLPHLHAYGQKGSGKSMFGESIQALFFSGKDSDGNMYKPMNLNQGTDFAFFNRYERFSNVPNLLNEFDENGIKEEWFRAIKSSYDSEGREKGKGMKNRTTSQKIRCSTLIMGQYLGTKDDNSVLTRSLPLAFQVTQNRESQEVMWFRELKAAENKGLSGILCELLVMREEFRREYSDQFHAVMTEFQGIMIGKGAQLTDRILKNISSMITCVDFLLRRFSLPFSREAFLDHCAKYTMNLNELATRTSGISEFWNYVEYLLDADELEPGLDFAIKHGCLDVKLKDKTATFTEAKSLVFIRMNTIYMLYAKHYRQNTGKNSIQKDTLELYMVDQPYWVGRKDHRFTGDRSKKTTTTTCIVLELDRLPVNLDRPDQQNDPNEGEKARFVGSIHHEPTGTSIAGIWKFSLHVLKTNDTNSGDLRSEEMIIKCHTKDAGIEKYAVGDVVTAIGYVQTNSYNGRTFYRMDVSDILPGNVEGLADALGGNSDFDNPF